MGKTPYEFLEEYIRSMKPGDVLTYEDVQEILGSESKDFFKGRSRFYKLQKQLEGMGVILENIRRVGYRRINKTSEALDRVQHHWIPKAHRTITRAKTTLNAVPLGNLNKADQYRALAMNTMVTAAHLNIEPKQVVHRSKQYDGLSSADIKQLVAAGFTG